MAEDEVPTRPHDRNGRRYPFSGWMKRLANLKGSSDLSPNRWSTRRNIVLKNKRGPILNTPYPLSGTPSNSRRTSRNVDTSFQGSTSREGDRPYSQSLPSLTSSLHETQNLESGIKSYPPTVSTSGGGTAGSDAVQSKPGTMATAGGAISSQYEDEASIFSSPPPSVRSLTTTLTTVQSAALSNQLQNTHSVPYGQQSVNSAHINGNQQFQFSHQFPPSPASAVPPHLAPHGHTVTYGAATANNVLTDNASVLTLASSSKRRRRNSLDTNASIRALAPSSVFGGSRESLPLSVLGGNASEPPGTAVFGAAGIISRPSIIGLVSSERANVYSPSTSATSGVSRTNVRTDDGASIASGARSHIYSHSRNGSSAASASGVMTGSLTGLPTGQPVGQVGLTTGARDGGSLREARTKAASGR